MIIAIDPGIKGAFAYYDPDLGYLRVERVPVRWRLVNQKKRFEVDTRAVFQSWCACPGDITAIICEEPHAMPGAGAASQFAFGGSCGTLKAIVECSAIMRSVPRVLYVDPSAWKQKMSCPADKNRARLRAQQLFPEYVSLFARAGDDGVAEAAILAYYAAHGGEIPQKQRVAVQQRRKK